MESLNKRVRSTLKHLLLDFQKEEQCSIWPFLLPEVAQILNNTWYAALKSTPFEVFFGRESRLFQVDSFPVNVLPNDAYVALMSENGEYHLPDNNSITFYDQMVSLYHLKMNRFLK